MDSVGQQHTFPAHEAAATDVLARMKPIGALRVRAERPTAPARPVGPLQHPPRLAGVEHVAARTAGDAAVGGEFAGTPTSAVLYRDMNVRLRNLSAAFALLDAMDSERTDLLLRDFIAYLYTSDNEVIAATAKYVPLVALDYVISSLSYVLQGVLEGAGKPAFLENDRRDMLRIDTASGRRGRVYVLLAAARGSPKALLLDARRGRSAQN